MQEPPRIPFAIRILALVSLVPAAAELATAVDAGHAPLIGPVLQPYLERYAAARSWALEHWSWLLPVSAVALVLLMLAIRKGLLLWHNTVVAKLSGAHLEKLDHTFDKLRFDLRAELARTPEGKYFVGLDRSRKPVYLSEWDLDTHGHIMGHTGSGKTKSVLEPLMFQDMRAGKGVLFMDAKGSSENVTMMKALAAVTGRRKEIRVFALAYPEWSQTYNPVYIGVDGDPLATAERVFSVFPLEQEYYKGQAKLFFYSLIRLLAATGKPFNLVDARLCVSDDDILHYVYDLSDDRAAKWEIDKQLKQLGHKRLETFTGLYNALADYDHPLLNSYAPDIVIDDIMNERGIVYFNLPANRYPILAPAIGKIVLQHVKAVGALRQIDRDRYDQTPFAVNIDELNRFAFPELVPSLAMLRDAHVQFRLSHQSLGDLEQVDEVFARQVKDNTRWKIFLYENDPDHLEKVSRSYGTHMAFKKTVRFSLGPLFTWLNTGESSNREVEEFNLHPNRLKSLAPQGQGYLLLPDQTYGVSFEILPRFEVPAYPLPRRPQAEGLALYDLFVSKAADPAAATAPASKPSRDSRSSHPVAGRSRRPAPVTLSGGGKPKAEETT